MSLLVQGDRQVFGESVKILVGRVHGNLMARGNRTDQEVGVGALDSLGPAAMEERGCCDVVVRGDEQIGECRQMLLQRAKLCVIFDAGEQFLTNGSDDLDATVTNQVA